MKKSNKKVNNAAIKIQRRWREIQRIKKSKLLSTIRKAKEKEKEVAATQIQSIIRGRASRDEMKRKKDEEKRKQVKLKNANELCRRYLRRQYRKKLNKKKRTQQEIMIDSAIIIQRRWKLRQQMISYRLLKLNYLHKRKVEAAIKIQKQWHLREKRKAIKLIKLIKEAEEIKKATIASKLQKLWRGKKGREEYKKAQANALQLIMNQIKLENHLATRIQSKWRGKQGRKIAIAERLLKKKRWKEIYDNHIGKSFYYNQDTGEIRKRIPQDLLDLLPKPKCDNCEIILSTVECFICQEYFCNQCWTNVHFGGKRKTHAFRALYDYYNKRIDYGETEFPSCWPSEIEQDEYNGWFIRNHQPQLYLKLDKHNEENINYYNNRNQIIY